MCEVAIGTDTGGSVRIPAALCGLVGFKPSRQRVPTLGAFPLSTTLDSVGPIGRSVDDCAKADAIMTGEDFLPLKSVALRGLCFGIAQGLPLDGLDDAVATAFKREVARLDDAGVRISRETRSLFDEMNDVNAKGGIVPPEACAIHCNRMSRRAADIDPNVRMRIERGCTVSAADYADMLRERSRLVRAMETRLAMLDVLVMPATPIVAPTIIEVAAPEIFAQRNAALLRNTGIVNFLRSLCYHVATLGFAAGGTHADSTERP
jgi:aspartyl-tRNA(Asn)/glutamyl-tRNA(Gln) amidotransferase subunit A